MCLLLFTAIDMAAGEIATDREDQDRFRALYISEAAEFLRSDESLSYRAQCIETLKQQHRQELRNSVCKTAREPNHQSIESESNHL
jgi:predicted chitinase